MKRIELRQVERVDQVDQVSWVRRVEWRSR